MSEKLKRQEKKRNAVYFKAKARNEKSKQEPSRENIIEKLEKLEKKCKKLEEKNENLQRVEEKDKAVIEKLQKFSAVAVRSVHSPKISEMYESLVAENFPGEKFDIFHVENIEEEKDDTLIPEDLSEYSSPNVFKALRKPCDTEFGPDLTSGASQYTDEDILLKAQEGFSGFYEFQKREPKDFEKLIIHYGAWETYHMNDPEDIKNAKKEELRILYPIKKGPKK